MTAEFFISPQFKPDMVMREIKAIESEYRLTQNDDYCRREQIIASCCRKGHVMNSFGWGNTKSLVEYSKKAGVDICAEVERW